MKKIRMGTGAGYSGDRIEPAVELATKGEIRYLILECLAERTIALDQQAKLKDLALGFDPLLERRMEALLPVCSRNSVRLITNMGAANPQAAALKTKEIARRMGITEFKIAVVHGDDLWSILGDKDYTIQETGERLSTLKDRIISANAYLGAEPIVEALDHGADVVITGRVADPSLFLAPMIHEFSWKLDDWDTLGQGTVVGHLMECAGQITGGYFADPGYKDVPGLGRLGFPIAQIEENGTAIITKVPEAGGLVSLGTCKEQLVYEIHDPTAYVTPDVIADFSKVQLSQVGPDQVQVSGGKGNPRTDSLKVMIGYLDDFIGEGQISYAGPGAVTRGHLALEIVTERLKLTGVQYQEIKMDLIGVSALHGFKLGSGHDPYEVRLRVAARTQSMSEAIRIGNEVETLLTNGPAGGGGSFQSARQVVAMGSILFPRSLIRHKIHYEEI